jgi:hypothetical protein
MNAYVDFSVHKFFEVTADLGEYKNSQGEKKRKYQKIGAVIDTKHGPMLKLDVIPLAPWEGYAYINEPHEKEKPKSEPRPNRNRDISEDDDRIPF